MQCHWVLPDISPACCPRRRLLLRGLLCLRAHADHQQWRDAVHEAVVRLRWRNMLRGWRRWARQQRVEAAAFDRSRGVYERRLLVEAWHQWAWLARNKARRGLGD